MSRKSNKPAQVDNTDDDQGPIVQYDDNTDAPGSDAPAAPPKRRGRKPGSKNKPKAASGGSDELSVRLDVQMGRAQIERVLQEYVVTRLDGMDVNGGTFAEMELQVNITGSGWAPLGLSDIRYITKGTK